MKKRILAIAMVLAFTAAMFPTVGRATEDAGYDVPSGVLSGVYETTPAEAGTLNDVISGVYGTTPVESGEPGDVVSGVFETTPVDDAAGDVLSGTFETTPADAQDGVVYGDTDFDADPSESVIYDLSEDGDSEDVDENLRLVEDEALGEGSLLGEEGFDIWAQDVISMVMPVIPEHTLDFLLDPMDLLSRFAEHNERYEKSSLYFKHTIGEISYHDISENAIATNKSSVPVLLDVTLSMVNEYGLPVVYTNIGEVERDYEANLGFSLVPVAVDPETGEETPYIDQEINIDENGEAHMVILLPGTIDNFEEIDERLIPREDAQWVSAGFAIRGACSTLANWATVFPEDDKDATIKIKVTYKMSELSQAQLMQIEEGLTADEQTGVIEFIENASAAFATSATSDRSEDVPASSPEVDEAASNRSEDAPASDSGTDTPEVSDAFDTDTPTDSDANASDILDTGAADNTPEATETIWMP